MSQQGRVQTIILSAPYPFKPL